MPVKSVRESFRLRTDCAQGFNLARVPQVEGAASVPRLASLAASGFTSACVTTSNLKLNQDGLRIT